MGKVATNGAIRKRAVILPTKIVPLAALVPNERNYNAHPASQIEDLRESLRQYGQVKEIAVKPIGNGKYEIEAGHGLTVAAQREGWTELKAAIIPRTWSRTKTLSYLAADNTLPRAANPDEAQLAALVREVMEQEGEALARLAAGEQSALDALLAGVPNFQPTGIGAQGRLDEKKKAICPQCGHEFTPT